MWYVARTFALLSILPLLATGCSLRILGVDKNSLTNDGTSASSSGSDEDSSNNGINSFSVLGATGGSDTTADTYLTDGTTLTAEWVDTSGEDSYEVKILDSTGSSTLCGPVTVPANSTSYTFTSCSLTHGAAYRIQVTAKNSSSGAAQSSYTNFQTGPFLSVGDLSVNEWGVASIPVSLSYAVGSSVSVQYVTADSTAQGGSDYVHSPLSTLTIPAGQTSAMISIPLLSDRSVESLEQFRVELSSPSGAGLLSTQAQVTLQDDDLSPATGLNLLASGAYHNCAVTSAGAVKCWGENGFGQLGTNDLISRSVPTQVLTLTSGISQVVVQVAHSCALNNSGGVQCWGDNSLGQFGDNSTTNSLTPKSTFGLSSGVSQLSAGYAHTCALLTSGGVKCWGDNSDAQLGDNTLASKIVPTDVVGLSASAVQIASGATHSCAILSTGALQCWGRNHQGQIGDNTTIPKVKATDVIGLSSGVIQVTAGDSHTCALLSTGAVKCWGRNATGQVGDNSTTARSVPTDVVGLSSGVTQVAAGDYHSCALLSSGSIKCWGNNSYGQLGDNAQTNRNVPTDVLGISSGVAMITAGAYHTCALMTSGSIQCWGSESSGELGNNGQGPILTPTDVSGLASGISSISTGTGGHTCVVNASGGVQCWGSNTMAQLGDNTTLPRSTPNNVTGLSSGVSQITTGSMHTCALTTAGGVKCWGYNVYGQVGDGSFSLRGVPTDVSGLSSGVTQITSSSFHTCALTSAGAVKCWGMNSTGQLGDNTNTHRSVPTDVTGLSSGMIQVSAGGFHTCALSSSGGVKCWGNNSSGELGDNTMTTRLVPTDVAGLTSGVTQIHAGTGFTCALTSAGAVLCWGANTAGQIGDNTLTNRKIPTAVDGLTSGVTQVSTGFHACAITSIGSVKCWGTNAYGQVGDTTRSNRSVPTAVSGLGSGISQVSAGSAHSCALTTGGGVKCWGDNQSYQIGEGHSHWVPQFVLSP